MDDLTLLREYAARNSEAAFAELVSRRVGFVYSAALRQVRDPHLAEEITQAVFIILAQKAGRISDQTILAGWLFKTTRFAALTQTRAAAKRSLRTATIEQEMQMQTEIQSAAPDPLWEQLSPLLDEALASLGETDRQAVLLRFFENKSLAEVGSHLGTGEDTARKRVSRALEKLNRYFSKRGVASTTAIIALAISANSVQAAPLGLTATVTVAAAKGAAVSGSTLTLIKGALKIMAWTKAKTVIVAGGSVLLAVSTATMVVVEKTRHTAPAVSGQQYQVNGTIEGSHFKRDGTLGYANTFNFEMCVSNCSWELTYTPKKMKLGANDYQRFSFDGTDLYVFFDMETAAGKIYADESAKGMPQRATPNMAVAAVVEQEIPRVAAGGDGAGIVWLAYASGCYFKKQTTNLIEIPWPHGENGDVYFFEHERHQASWELDEAFPGLPKRSFYRQLHYPEFTNAQYAVTSFRKFENYVLPEEAVFEVYIPHKFIPLELRNTTPPTKMILRDRYVIKASAFMPLKQAVVCPPPVPVLTSVVDHRFNSPTDPARNTPVPYDVSKRFLTKDEARNSSNYYTFKVAYPAAAAGQKPSNKPAWARAGVVILIVSALIVFLFRWLRGKGVPRRE